MSQVLGCLLTTFMALLPTQRATWWIKERLQEVRLPNRRHGGGPRPWLRSGALSMPRCRGTGCDGGVARRQVVICWNAHHTFSFHQIGLSRARPSRGHHPGPPLSEISSQPSSECGSMGKSEIFRRISGPLIRRKAIVVTDICSRAKGTFPTWHRVCCGGLLNAWRASVHHLMTLPLPVHVSRPIRANESIAIRTKVESSAVPRRKGV